MTKLAGLADVERRARDLPWGKERPWSAKTHIWEEGGLLTVNLHDLSVRLAVAVVRAVADSEPDAVCLITGRGRHTGGASPLRDAVMAAVDEIARERGWKAWVSGPGRLMLAQDASLVPRPPVSALSVLMVIMLAVGLGALWLPLALIPVAVALLSRRR